jgi:hypothetical protein
VNLAKNKRDGQSTAFLAAIFVNEFAHTTPNTWQIASLILCQAKMSGKIKQ